VKSSNIFPLVGIDRKFASSLACDIVMTF
jgi:hypothetical protein